MPTTPEPVVPPTVQADTLNWMREQITRLNDLTVEGAEYEQVPGGRQLRIPKPPVGFWARVRKAGESGSGSGSDSGSGSCQAYDWWEQEPIGCGHFQDDEFGRTGTLENGDPAYSIPPNAVVPDDSIVWLTKGLAAVTPEEELSGTGSGEVTEPVIQEWYFQLGTGGDSGSDTGSDACENMAANFPVRTPASALTTDLLLTSDPVNGTTVNHELRQLLDAQLLTTSADNRKWPGRLRADSRYGSVKANADAATITFDLGVNGSNLHEVTGGLGGNRTLAVSGGADGQAFAFLLPQDGTGGRSVTWFSGVKWLDNLEPTIDPTPGAVTLVSFIQTGTGAYRHTGTLSWDS